MDRHSEGPPVRETDEQVIPVVEEEVVAGARRVKTGSVRVEKHVQKTVRRIEAPLVHDDVEVRRVPVNRAIDKIPPARRKGNVIIVPVVEEELVVTKRLVLKEEIHLIRHRTRERTVKEVELEKETAEVSRLDAEGRLVDASPEGAPPARGKRLRSMLG